MIMSDEKIACSHPGKIGDANYSLPTVKRIAELEHCQVDFYTSEVCRPLKRLFEYQSYIDKFYIPDNYKVERMDMGVQPWYVPIDGHLYKKTYQLGFRSCPNTDLPTFIGNQVGVDGLGRVQYEYPDFETLNEPYYVLAPRGNTTYKDLFIDFVNKSPIPVVSIGAEGEFNYINAGINKCGLDILETVTWIAKSQGFVGLMSSQLTLANGFDIPKVAVHDGRSWDMRHVVRTLSNYYPVNPSAEDILKILEGKWLK